MILDIQIKAPEKEGWESAIFWSRPHAGIMYFHMNTPALFPTVRHCSDKSGWLTKRVVSLIDLTIRAITWESIMMSITIVEGLYAAIGLDHISCRGIGLHEWLEDHAPAMGLERFIYMITPEAAKLLNIS